MVEYNSLEEELDAVLGFIREGSLNEEERAKRLVDKLGLSYQIIELALKTGAEKAYQNVVSNVLNMPGNQRVLRESIPLLMRFDHLDIEKLSKAIQEGSNRSARVKEENRAFWKNYQDEIYEYMNKD